MRKTFWFSLLIIMYSSPIFADGNPGAIEKVLLPPSPSSQASVDAHHLFNEKSLEDRYNVARAHYVAGNYELCLSELATLHREVDSFKNSKELEGFCKQGVELRRHYELKSENQRHGGSSPRLSTHVNHFKNLYLSFEMPENWLCTTDRYQFVCGNKITKSKDALIMLTAQETKPGETLEVVQSYLAKSKTRKSEFTGNTVHSRLVSSRPITIGNQKWVESIHENSEMDGYTTRYLATVKNGFTIFFTFSVKQEQILKYEKDVARAVETLQQSNLTRKEFIEAIGLYSAAKTDYSRQNFADCLQKLKKVHAIFQNQDSKELEELCTKQNR